ncbi:MAG: alpha/beta hydrolase [Planctomycetota bacterium]
MSESEAHPKRRRLPWYARWVLYIAAIYLAYCTLLFFVQHKLIFPAAMAGQAQPIPVHRDAVKLEIDTEQGTSVAWFIPAPGSSGDNPTPIAIFFHGNAELVDHQHAIIDLYHSLGASVLLPEYRGYGGDGGSEGSPSQAHLVADAEAFYDLAVVLPGVDGERVVIHGRSIGGGVAAQLADRRPCAAVVVESTGTSVARKAWGFGVPPFIVRSPFYTARVFHELDVPVMIMHGEHDDIFPYQHARDLLAAAPNGVLVPFDAGHNDLGTGPERERYGEVVETHLRNAGVIPAATEEAHGH